MCLFSAGQFSAGKLFQSPAARNVLVRLMSGHKRTIEFKPTNFEWKQYKDHLHFYVLLGVIPIAAIITATNLFIGPGELIDTPEDYEPKHWEYYKSPISQFIARHFHDSPEKLYERHMHFVNVEKDKILMRQLEKKVELLVGEAGHRNDSKRWFYIPANVTAPQQGVAFEEENESTRGFR